MIDVTGCHSESRAMKMDSAVLTSDEPHRFPALSGPQWVAEKRLLADAINSGAVSVDHDTRPSKRHLFFFYGSLMDSDVLKTIVGDPEEPILLDAWVEGYEMKMWQGIYPTLLPLQGTTGDSEHAKRVPSGCSSGSQTRKIHGKAWYASDLDQCLALQSYETSAYELLDCDIHVIKSPHDGHREDVIPGMTFIWAGNLSDERLTQGTFSLEHWIKEVKPIVWR